MILIPWWALTAALIVCFAAGGFWQAWLVRVMDVVENDGETKESKN